MSVSSLNIIPDEGFVCEDFWKEKKKIRRIAKNIDRCDLKNNVRERSLSVVYHFKKFPPLLTFTPWHVVGYLRPMWEARCLSPAKESATLTLVLLNLCFKFFFSNLFSFQISALK